MLAAGLAGLVLFVVVVAGAAAGVIDIALGTTSASTSPTGGDSATTAPTNGPLKSSLVPGYLIPLFTGAARVSGCGLTPALLAAQADVESGFQVDAISSAGAVGIMQFLPSTWAGDGIDADGDGQASITDPADAIYSAAGLDCTNLHTIKDAGIEGDPIALMFAAYNAGLGAVLGCRCLPAITQTRNYITSILAIAPTLATPPTAGESAGRLDYPLAAKAVVTQTYGAQPGGNFHPGIDLAAPAGTAVLAATGGQVTYAGWETGYGNYVCLAAPTFTTCYAHLANITVALGQTVSTDQQLGTEGETGDATGPHLHFEVHINGHPVNPAPYLGSS